MACSWCMGAFGFVILPANSMVRGSNFVGYEGLGCVGPPLHGLSGETRVVCCNSADDGVEVED